MVLVHVGPLPVLVVVSPCWVPVSILNLLSLVSVNPATNSPTFSLSPSHRNVGLGSRLSSLVPGPYWLTVPPGVSSKFVSCLSCLHHHLCQ